MNSLSKTDNILGKLNSNPAFMKSVNYPLVGLFEMFFKGSKTLKKQYSKLHIFSDFFLKIIKPKNIVKCVTEIQNKLNFFRKIILA